MGSLSSLGQGTLSLTCLLCLLSGDLVYDLLIDLGDHMVLEDLFLEIALPLGVTERLPDVLEAALPLGVAERLLEDVTGAGGFLVVVLLLSG
jgi:hypothetical protein